jgi:hypothetical protein
MSNTQTQSDKYIVEIRFDTDGQSDTHALLRGTVVTPEGFTMPFNGDAELIEAISTVTERELR